MDERFEQTLAAARAGDERAFRELTERHRRELQAHCYRMLGSLGTPRTWCRRPPARLAAAGLVRGPQLPAVLALQDRHQRLPRRARQAPGAQAAGGRRPGGEGPDRPRAPPVTDPVWLEPYPDELLADTEPDPEAVYTSKQVHRAGVPRGAAAAAPGSARCAAPARRPGLARRRGPEFLQMSVPAANSALQRARATLEERKRAGHEPEAPMKEKELKLPPLLARYVQAWEKADVPALAALLREDAVLAMPPMPTWFRGREAIAAWVAAALFGGGDAAGRFRLVPTRANGCDAFAVYRREPASGRYQALAIQVVELEGGLVRDLTSFLDPRLFPRFGLPATLGDA
jgi:RNA polymerase sigma-70 factor (ECF subfamily)